VGLLQSGAPDPTFEIWEAINPDQSPEASVPVAIRMRHQLHISLARNIGLSMSSNARCANQPKEDKILRTRTFFCFIVGGIGSSRAGAEAANTGNLLYPTISSAVIPPYDPSHSTYAPVSNERKEARANSERLPHRRCSSWEKRLFAPLNSGNPRPASWRARVR